jgi:ParB family chromosome partitioning protein
MSGRASHLSLVNEGGRVAARELATRHTSHAEGQSLTLPIGSIRPNPDNPRRTFQDRALDDLAESIRRWGQLQPVVVRRVDDYYQLVCGERRWRAHVRARLPTIWAVELDVSTQDAFAMALAENLQRVGLSHVEKLAALDQLAEIAHVRGLRNTANQLGVDPSWLSRQLSVRKDPTISPALENGEIGFGQAAELLRAPARARQTLLTQVIQSPTPVRTNTIRHWVDEARRDSRANAPAPSAFRSLVDKLERLGRPASDADFAALADLLEHVHRLLATDGTATAAKLAHRAAKQRWLELTCLVCGEDAGAIVERHEVRPSHNGSVRQSRNQLVCGRCGGKLAAGAQRERYVYTS